MPGSKIVVNHRVMLSGSTGHGAIGGNRLLYIANRPGAVIMKSEDDLRIGRENERMAKLGYIGYRPGSGPSQTKATRCSMPAACRSVRGSSASSKARIRQL